MAADLIAQHLAMGTPDLRSMSQPPAMDQDMSATLSDFLTYTEHLPSSVVRSLTLIQSLNRKASGLRLHMHDLLTQYTQLPSTPSNASDPVQLRKDISNTYDQLHRCHRMSTAEATRLQDTVIKDGAKLHVVQGKLKTLPMPPSRDATPEPALTSPQLRRNATAHHAADKRAPQHRTGTAPRVRIRKVMVPGEVLPPPNPDSPPPSDLSTSPSPPPPHASPDETKAAQKTLGRQKTPKPPKMPKERPPKTPRIRPPGVSGTNAHSAVAGISTSNALMALTAPPPDAKPGSKWLPWKRLTEYEMATLRKRMKKNAIWLPSPAMRNRELKNLGRGTTAMEDAKLASEASGEPFVDEYDPATWTDPTRVAITGEEQAETNAMLGPEQSGGDGDDALINRGMRLNEAKKLKREKQKLEEQQALQQQQQQPPQKDEKAVEPKPQTLPKPAEAKPEDEIMVDLEPEVTQPVQEPEPEVTQPVQEPDQESELVPLPEPELQPAPKAKSEPRSRKTPKAKPVEVPEPPTIELSQPEPELELKPPTRPGPSTLKASRAQSSEVVKVVAPPEPQGADIAMETAPKKRKRDATPPGTLPAPTETAPAESSDELPLPRAAPPPKKIKLSVTAPPPPEKATTSISTRASTANAASSPAVPNPPVAPSPRMSMRPRSQRPSAAPESAAAATTTTTTTTTAVQPAALPPPAVSRSTRSNPTIHIKPSKAASAEPTNRRASLRRGSNASLPGSTTKMHSPALGITDSTPAARRRSKRPVPGLVTAEEDGSAKVSVGKRKTAPRKKAAPRTTPQSTPAPQPKGAASKKESSAQPATEDEAVDPDEPRYCVCGDVSWGTMIACDASDCEKEWFHLECVKLEENPPRRTKWYCPDCRKRLKLGQSTNGIVR